jgi:hypothetical protein
VGLVRRYHTFEARFTRTSAMTHRKGDAPWGFASECLFTGFVQPTDKSPGNFRATCAGLVIGTSIRIGYILPQRLKMYADLIERPRG